MADNIMEQLTDDLIISMSQVGNPSAITEATRRGLTIPEQPDTSPDTIPTQTIHADTVIDDDTPREQLPVGILLELIADGDTTAAQTLHERYPYLYDENGNEIEYEKPLP